MSKYVSKKFCAVAVCTNTSDIDKSLSWHRFPKSDVRLRKLWVRQCRRADPINLNSSRVCSAHFTLDDYQKNFKAQLLGTPERRFLKPNAFPTLFLQPTDFSEDIPVPNPRKRKQDPEDVSTDTLNPKIIAKSKRTRKLDETSFLTEEISFEIDEQNDDHNGAGDEYLNLSRKMEARGVDEGIFECTINLSDEDDDITIDENGTNVTIPKEAKSHRSLDTNDCDEIITIEYEANSVSKVISRRKASDPELIFSPPSKKAKYDEREQSPIQLLELIPTPSDETKYSNKCFGSCSRERASLKKVDCLRTDTSFERPNEVQAPTKASLLDKLFSSNQVSSLMNTNKRIHWNDDEIFEAIKLRFFSMPMYKYLAKDKGFPFPGKPAISRWARKMKLRGGILHNVLRVMELSGKHLSANSKSGIRDLCVLAVAEIEMKETIEYDEIHDEIIGPFQSMQVMVAVSLTSSWRQLVFVDFNSKITKLTIVDATAELYKIGYHVACLSTDCSNTSIKLWSDLGASSDNPSYLHPVNEQPIVIMPDTLHIMRLIREALLSGGIEVEGEVISRTPLDLLLESGVCPKLTDRHLRLNDREKHRTDLAVQLLSATVGTALIQHESRQVNAATSTANFIKVVNHWFDLMNVSSPEVTVPFRSPYGYKRAEQDKLLNHVKSLMSSVKLDKSSSLRPYHIGITMSCNGLPLLLDETSKHYKQTCIRTQFLNHSGINRLFVRNAQSVIPSPVTVLNKIQSDLFGTNSDANEHCVFAHVMKKSKINLFCHSGYFCKFKSMIPESVEKILSHPEYVSEDSLPQSFLNILAIAINSALKNKFPQLRKFPSFPLEDPTDFFLGHLVKMEKLFAAFARRHSVSECKNIVGRLTRIMKRFTDPLPVEVIRMFVRLRIEIFVGSLVPKISKVVIKRRMLSQLLRALGKVTE